MNTASKTLLAIACWLAVASAGFADDRVDRDALPSTPETERSSTLREVYFPFLALGHGVLLVAEYGVGYPIYYLVKPVIDFAYSSSEDPRDFPNSRR